MLIIPLHRRPTVANFPWVTLGLVLANVFVFAFLQSGDASARTRALDYYAGQDIAHWEFPAYRQWLDAHADDAERRAVFEETVAEGDMAMATQVLQSDAGFLAALRGDVVIPETAAEHGQWRERRAEFDRLWNAAFTERWMLHFSEVDPGRILGAMFLHGGAGHLLGNMLFLALLGLLVEGALGHGLFLAVYLVGGFGSALLSLAWRWGESGNALGASGAIAALMGAFCVLWGLRKVRFFWWFFVVFDYVKAPALVLLPLWLGWQVANMIWNSGAHVGFDAHVGGIIVGAVLALGVRALGWERRDFLDEDELADAAASEQAALAQAQAHLGRLEVAAARALLEPIAAQRPDDFEVLVALYRCARYEAGMPRLHGAARAVLAHPARSDVQVRTQKTVFDDYIATGSRQRLLPSVLLALCLRWPAIGASARATSEMIALVARAPMTPGLEAACLALARDLRARGEREHATALLECVLRAWPQSGAADKARILLGDAA